MSKAHSSDGFRQRIKQLLGIRKGPAITSGVLEGPKSEEFSLHQELLQEIGKESATANRVKVLKELCEFFASRRLEEHAIESAWVAVEDLLQSNSPIDARHVTFQFLTVIVSGQFDRLSIMRAHFFRVIANHKHSDDLQQRIELLKALSDEGKDITYFEEQIGPFLLSLMPEVIKSGKSSMLMPLLINAVHYNQSYLDENIVSGIVRETCCLATTAKQEQDVDLSLRLLDAIVRYSCLPSDALYNFIVAVCHTVNVERFCQYSWKIMRNLLGTHLGHSGVQTMCSIMEDSESISDVLLLRGSVFFIGMCLWGSQRVTTLRHSHSTVLPSMLQALSSHVPIVAVEVTVSIQRLVKKYGQELHIVTWDAVLDITEALQDHIENHPPADNVFMENYHLLLNYIEELYEKKKFNGSPERFFQIVERCAAKRPEASLLNLVTFKANMVHPAKGDWLGNLNSLMEKYFRYEIRTNVRVKVLDVLSFVLTSYRHWYEEELLDLAVLPYLGQIAEDQDVTVRTRAVQLLVDLAQTCESAKFVDILKILEKVISRHVELMRKLSPPVQLDEQLCEEERELKDIKTAVNGLVEMFKVKLFRFSHAHAQGVYELLVHHLRAHYYHGYSTQIASVIRNIIFECFLELRSDSSHRMGIIFDGDEPAGKVKYSPYFFCGASDQDSSEAKVNTSHLGVIPFADAFSAMLSCLQYEWDWTVLEHLLVKLPKLLQNKTLILSAEPNLNTMSSMLCKMVTDPSFLIDLQRVPQGVGRASCHAVIFPVLIALATYHSRLDRIRQSELVKTLQLGLGSKCASLCVSSLMLCTMEMQTVMISLLPELLIRLSQISATVSMATPMLEFLSGLVHLPHLYTSFQDGQYKSVFAICLPYTDAFKYSQYTVTLAYHVIAAWFVRSRIQYRKGFVSYISKGLKSNAVLPERYDYSRMDSPVPSPSLRSRSSSVCQSTPVNQSINQPPVRSATPNPAGNSPNQGQREVEQARELHTEMTEVCVDMMARYTFASCMSQPSRTTAMEFLLSQGQSRSWLIGFTVVTITTAGISCILGEACENSSAVRNPAVCHKQQNRLNTDPKSDKTKPNRIQRSSSPQPRDVDFVKDRETKAVTPGNERRGSDVSLHTSSMPGKDSSRLTTPPSTTAWQSTPQVMRDGVKKQSSKSSSYSSPVHSAKRSRDRPVSPDELSGNTEERESIKCSCVCQGWAEIFLRRPSGNTSWIMRIENQPRGISVENDLSTALIDDQRLLYTSMAGEETSDKRLRLGSSEILSRSEGQDTLVIDVLSKDSRTEIKLPEKPTDLIKDSAQEWQNDSESGSEKSVTNRESLDSILLYSGTTENCEESVTSLQGSTDSLAHSYQNRSRLLSKSPKDPRVFRMRDSVSSECIETTESRVQEHTVKLQLDFNKPELGISPLDQPCLLPFDGTIDKLILNEQSDERTRGDSQESQQSETRYLSSSDMYRLASDEESVQSFSIDQNEDVCKGEERDKPATPTTGRRKKTERPKSVPLETLYSRNSDENQQEKQTECIQKAQKPQNPTSPKLPEKGSFSSTVHSPKKRALTKSLSMSSPRGMRQTFHSRESSPFRDPKASHSSHNLGQGTTGLPMTEPKKCASSPELCSPVAPRKVLAGGQSEVKTRLHSTPNESPSQLKRHVNSAGREDGITTKDAATDSFRQPLDPNFVFLQLYHSSFLGLTHERPLPLPEGEVMERAVKVLDRIPPYDTHKIGIIYVGPGQHESEAAILRNVYGSSRYIKFLAGLGQLVRLRDCSLAEVYTGGLDRNGADGEFAYSWQDDISQVIFHISTLMPNKDSDPGCHSKKLHIGNDFVTIVYNDSDEDVKFGVIRGQFNFAEIVVKPLDQESNCVSVRFKEELKDQLVDTGPRVISDCRLPILVRQLAVHVNMASAIHQSQKRPTDAYGCNWLERLRQIKRLRSKAQSECFVPPSPPPTVGKAAPGTGVFNLRPNQTPPPQPADFTEYILSK